MGTTYAQGQRYAGPEALGPFRIDKDISMNSLFARLGKPSSTTADIFCYRSAHGQAFLTITRMVEVYDAKIAGTVTLASFRNCVNHSVQVTRDDLTLWRTEKGISLSSTQEQVERAYGKPSKVDTTEGTKYGAIIYGYDPSHPPDKKPQIGSKVLVYRGAPDDLSTAIFGIRNGRVVWILLSKNE